MDDLLDKLFKQKTENGKKPLQIQGLSFIHPLHEALIAFFKRNVSDGQICQMFANDENSLRKAISLEVLADQLDVSQRNQALAKLKGGASQKEVVELMALYLSEGQRTFQGNILKEMEIPYNSTGKSRLEAIRRAKLTPIYLDASKVEDLNTKAVAIKKRRLKQNIAESIALVTIATLIGFYSFTSLKSMKENQKRLNELEKSLVSYSNVIKQLPYTEQQAFISKYEQEIKK